MYNLYRRAEPYRFQYKKIYSNESLDMVNKEIDKLLSIGVNANDLIVRKGLMETEIIGWCED